MSFSRIAAVLNKAWQQLKNVSTGAGRNVFGEFSWQAPGWWRWLSKQLGVRRQALLAAAYAQPRRSAWIIASLVALTAGSFFGWRWYLAQPKPLQVSFAVAAPAVTCYGCEPPGKPNALIVRFEQSVAPLERSGKALDPKRSGLSFEPLLTGEWRWSDDKTLNFQPAADWPVGQHYAVSIARQHVVAAQIHLANYDFEFDSPAFVARISNTEFYQDPVIAADKKVVVSIAFSHPVDPTRFEKNIQLKMFTRTTDTLETEIEAPKFSVVYDKLKLNAYIHSDKLSVPPKEARLQVSIGKGLKAARGGNVTAVELVSNVTVPGLNSLKISDVSLSIARDERNEPRQILLVNAAYSVLEGDMQGKVKAWLLPEKNPDAKLQAEFERYNRGRPYSWNESSVTPTVIAAGTPLELNHEPGELQHYEAHGFRYQANPGRYVYVKIEQGLKSFGGYVLGDTLERILTVPEFPRELQLLHQGSLVALSGDQRVTFFSRNVQAIKVEVGRLLPKQIQHLVTQTAGKFSQPQFQSWAFKDADITERFSKTISLPAAAPGESHYEAFDLGDFLDNSEADKRGVFLLRTQAWDVANNRPVSGYEAEWNAASDSNENLSDARLIVVTDLGLLVKRANDGSQDVFVQSIKSGEPAAGVTVEVLGRNGVAVMSETTTADGHVHFNAFKGLRNEQQPVVYVARRNGDSSFIPVEQRDRVLDMSRFDVGGVESSTDHNALSAYVFSDRGLYRPGEAIHLAAIIRSQDWARSLSGVPMMLEVTDPRGTVIRRETFAAGTAGLAEISQDTKLSSPTGTYTFAIATVRNGAADHLIGSTTVQVRDFQPDRLRMNTHFSTEMLDGWVAPEQLKAEVQLNNLFGTPAEKRRVSSVLTLSPALPAFRSYPDYQFYDPQFARESFSEALADSSTDANGHAVLELNLQRFTHATYRAHLVTQGFEADGGRGVSAEATQLVSNMPFLVGYKADGDLSYVARNAQRDVQLLAIDPKLQRRAATGLKLAHIELRYVSVLLKQGNGTYKYESRKKEIAIDSQALNIAVAGYAIKLATAVPGNFAYLVRDASDQVLARVEYQVAGDANVTRQLEKNAELELGLSKPDYLPGEDLELSIRAPYAGAGLITIERERVFTWRWFKTNTTSSVQHITLPKELEGNAYVSVSFVRDPGSTEIYTSPLSYGVKPFTIDTNARKQRIEVQTAGTIKPGQALKLRYHTDAPARIVLFAVDEGILQVARYQTPDPLGFFFQKRALQVTSTQILDLILPAFRQLGLGAAPGGDAEGLIGRNLNPFRRKGEAPVAYWSGILDADSTTREVQYTVPDYFNGSLKVFAIAVSDARVAVNAGNVTVRGDFVLTPTAPTTATPGDEFEVSVGIANNLQGSGANAKLRMTLNTDAGLAIVGAATQELTIAEGREGVARYRLKTRDRLGASAIKFVAGIGNSSVTRSIDLSIRPATPHMTSLSAGMMTSASQELRIERSLYPEYRKLNTGISLLPLSLAHGLVSYLADYPYQCTEQIVSQAMPAVVLGARPEFGYVKKLNGADLATLISELRARQNDNGAYKLWPGGDFVNEFVSLYAQHFLLEARERGQAVPNDLLTQGNAYLRQLAVRDGNNLTQERNTAYAIYLLTRQGQRTSAEISAQQQRLATRYAKQWPQDLTAGWLAAALSLMKQDRDAERLLRAVKFNIPQAGSDDYDPYADSQTRDAMLLYITARYFPSRLPQLPGEVLSNLVKQINAGTYHTLSIGANLLALDAYATATGRQSAQLTVSEVLRDRTTRGLKLPGGLLMPTTSFTDQATALRFTNDGPLSAFYLVEQSGFERKPPAQAIKQGLEVIRDYTDEQGKPLIQVQLGQEVTVHVKFRNLSQGSVGTIAVVDLLPGGFELVVPSTAASNTYYQAESTAAETEGETEQTYEGEGEGEEAAQSTNVYAGAAFSGWSCQVCTSGTTAQLQYADLREDRVVFYAEPRHDISEITYRIKATNVGSFMMPPAYGEAMYDRNVIARSAAAQITIVRAP